MLEAIPVVLDQSPRETSRHAPTLYDRLTPDDESKFFWTLAIDGSLLPAVPPIEAVTPRG